MNQGYTLLDVSFSMYDLTGLTGHQALTVRAASGQELFVRTDESVGGGIIEGRICLSEAFVTRVDSTQQPVRCRHVSALIRVGHFWQYDSDLMSNRVESIRLMVQTVI